MLILTPGSSLFLFEIESVFYFFLGLALDFCVLVIVQTLDSVVSLKSANFIFCLRDSHSGGAAVIHLPIQETQEMRAWSQGLEVPLEEEMATHSSYSCLENSMNRGAWQATIHEVTKS